MNCNQCGAEAPASAAYCSQCGAQLNSGVGMTAADRQTGAARMQAGSSRDTSRNAPEEELWAGTYAPKAIAGPFVGAALLTALGMVAASFAGPVGWIVVAVGALLMFGYLGLLLLYRRLTVRYRLTTQRLLRETGILSRTDDRILVIEIDDVTVRQGFVDRMLDVGSVVLHTSDDSTPVLTMSGIEQPRHLADLIDEARRTERNRRALYTMNA